ncbi:preprotein translocase subunit SecE [Candidatus Collierbacteria bacterium CG17_big_fil_post_rev_8_21_14_2_50_45_7]|uniref:Protein translocase subunit SecE n=2 Tax=Candidatus Collieribacteriota TaxID=1752725 RepID=A0A2H0WYN3_9BACT|nr:MAG: preprotein translocase subunit SecE [Candidatus Collierbacteria bacterium CG09_land_8_20_14_0_10_46_12]PIW07877.1 MAG: preprotein translocase subunit SecE [Candidatus Collierbacteria bacterium CG17_big_fil_post_rev_8_21_14_2_50_45_7]
MNILNYLKEVRVELGKVTWTTRAEATHLTLIIIIASLVVGLYIGGLDIVFTNLLGIFLK